VTHVSRLARVVIECHTDHVEHAAGFWSEALRHASEIDEDANCARLTGPDGTFGLVVQGVHDEPTIHVEIETNDLQTEVKRLAALGAEKISVVDHSVIMQAPTGHRFRVSLTAAARAMTT